MYDSEDDLRHDGDGYELDVDVRDTGMQTTAMEPIRHQRRPKGVVLLKTGESRRQRANRYHLQSQTLGVAPDSRPSEFHVSEKYTADMVKQSMEENK